MFLTHEWIKTELSEEERNLLLVVINHESSYKHFNFDILPAFKSHLFMKKYQSILPLLNDESTQILETLKNKILSFYNK